MDRVSRKIQTIDRFNVRNLQDKSERRRLQSKFFEHLLILVFHILTFIRLFPGSFAVLEERYS